MRAPVQLRRHSDPLRVVGRRILFAVVLILIALAVQAVWGAYQTVGSSEELRGKAETRMHELEEREARLKADIASLKSDRGVEEALRETYGLGKEGEGVVVIVESESAPVTPQETWSEKLFFWR